MKILDRWLLTFLLSAVTVALAAGVFAQIDVAAQEVKPQGFAAAGVAFRGVTAVIRPGVSIPNCTLVVRRGRITAVDANAAVASDLRVIDATGLVATAGWIDAGNSLLLKDCAAPAYATPRAVDTEREALAATRPDEHHLLTPQWDPAADLRLTAEQVNAWQAQGVLLAQVLPTGRLCSGQPSLLRLQDRPIRECRTPSPARFAFEFNEQLPGDRYPSTLMGQFAHVRQKLHDARWRSHQSWLFGEGRAGIERPLEDPVLQEFEQLLAGKSRPLLITENVDDVDRGLAFAKELAAAPLLLGPAPFVRRSEEMAAGQTGLIVTLDWGDEPKLASEPDEAVKNDRYLVHVPAPLRVRTDRLAQWRERIGALKALQQRGHRFAVSSHGLKAPAEFLKAIRRAISQGWPAADALAALTTDACVLLQIEGMKGTLEVGQPARLVLWNGAFDDDRVVPRYVVLDEDVRELNRDAKPVLPIAADLSALQGQWQVTLTGGEAPWTARLEMTQNKAEIGGHLRSDVVEGPLKKGKVEGDVLTFEVATAAGERSVALKFEARWNAAEGRLKGTMKSPFGPAATWEATRPPAPAAAKPPAVASLAGIELVDHDAAVSAEKTPSDSADELPTELPEDRRARRLKTGGNVLITAGTVLTGTGEVLTNTRILVKGGQIEAMGPDVVAPEGLTVLDSPGYFVMPGVIDTHNHMMIGNGGGVNEATHSIVCEVRVGDAINTSDSAEYRLSASGMTIARLLHGSANTIGGQHALVQLKHGATLDEHVLEWAPAGVKFALGENVKRRSGRFPNSRLGVEATLKRAFYEALAYRRDWQRYLAATREFPRLIELLPRPLQETAPRRASESDDNAPVTALCPDNAWLPPRYDERLEALQQIVSGQMFVHSHCYRSDEILMLLRLAEHLGFRIRSLQHVLEGYKLAPEIREHGASCSTFADIWAYKVEAYDATPFNASLLHYAGINSVVKTDYPVVSHPLILEAAKSVRYGSLPPDVAIQLVTRNAARELGIDQRHGTIEVGKQADLAIFNGHPLSTFARCEWTLVAGEVVFSRHAQPSAMSAETRVRTQAARPWTPKCHQGAPQVTFPDPLPERYALVGGTVYPVDGPPLTNGAVLVDGGRIAAVGTLDAIPAETTRVDVGGLSIYPGLIDAGTNLGLQEIASVQETIDSQEIGNFQPDLLACQGVNPESELIPVARAGGVTTVLCRPNSGVLAGRASMMQLAGWTSEQMTLKPEVGMVVLWPESDVSRQLDELAAWLERARIYDAARQSGNSQVVEDPRYEALRPYVRGERPVMFEADEQHELLAALKFAKRERLKAILVEATDAWKMTKELKEHDVPVIVSRIIRQPVREHDPHDAPFANPARLYEAGVKFCIRSKLAATVRNTPFEAGMAVAYGLPEEAALRSVTLSAAEILGMADELGSLTPGKRADIIVSDGTPLEPTSQIRAVIIAGRPQSLEARQTRLARKHVQRYREQVPADVLP